MSNESNSVSGGIGIPGALFVLFTGLKLTGYISWSWWWVTAPIWLPMAVIIPTALIFMVITKEFE